MMIWASLFCQHPTYHDALTPLNPWAKTNLSFQVVCVRYFVTLIRKVTVPSSQCSTYNFLALQWCKSSIPGRNCTLNFGYFLGYWQALPYSCDPGPWLQVAATHRPRDHNSKCWHSFVLGCWTGTFSRLISIKCTFYLQYFQLKMVLLGCSLISWRAYMCMYIKICVCAYTYTHVIVNDGLTYPSLDIPIFLWWKHLKSLSGAWHTNYIPHSI
jgi:hypothetical protein